MTILFETVSLHHLKNYNRSTQNSNPTLRRRKMESDASSWRQRPYAGGTVLLCDDENWNRTRHRSGNDLPQAGHSTCRHDGAAGGTILLCDDENWNRMRHRSGNDLPQAVHSTCRHDGTAVIPDFRPRIDNRCSFVPHSVDFRAAILDFKPRLANRCSQKAKTGANRASILDFKPRLGNRCNNASLSRGGKQSTVPHLIFGKVEENL